MCYLVHLFNRQFSLEYLTVSLCAALSSRINFYISPWCTHWSSYHLLIKFCHRSQPDPSVFPCCLLDFYTYINTHFFQQHGSFSFIASQLGLLWIPSHTFAKATSLSSISDTLSTYSSSRCGGKHTIATSS